MLKAMFIGALVFLTGIVLLQIFFFPPSYCTTDKECWEKFGCEKYCNPIDKYKCINNTCYELSANIWIIFSNSEDQYGTVHVTGSTNFPFSPQSSMKVFVNGNSIHLNHSTESWLATHDHLLTGKFLLIYRSEKLVLKQGDRIRIELTEDLANKVGQLERQVVFPNDECRRVYESVLPREDPMFSVVWREPKIPCAVIHVTHLGSALPKTSG